MKAEKKKTDIAESETWKICSKPPVAAFIFALASMIFSEEFMRLVQEKNWPRACFWVLCTWLGFFLFWCAVTAFAHTLLEKGRAKLFVKAGKWKIAFVVLLSIIVFAIAFYAGWFILPHVSIG